MDSQRPTYDLAVIGGGSAGFGAALAAARRGLKVVVVERGDALGGTATRGGVNCWEMGVGGTGIPFDLYRRLKRRQHVQLDWPLPAGLREWVSAGDPAGSRSTPA
jgi:glycine/D-amino acid oxidase-like deaminating enzyme